MFVIILSNQGYKPVPSRATIEDQIEPVALWVLQNGKDATFRIASILFLVFLVKKLHLYGYFCYMIAMSSIPDYWLSLLETTLFQCFQYLFRCFYFMEVQGYKLE